MFIRSPAASPFFFYVKKLNQIKFMFISPDLLNDFHFYSRLLNLRLVLNGRWQMVLCLEISGCVPMPNLLPTNHAWIWPFHLHDLPGDAPRTIFEWYRSGFSQKVSRYCHSSKIMTTLFGDFRRTVTVCRKLRPCLLRGFSRLRRSNVRKTFASSASGAILTQRE